jgi:hypothetical protein
MRPGAALSRSFALIWDPTFHGLVQRLERFLARGFTLSRERTDSGRRPRMVLYCLGRPEGIDARILAGELLV